MIVALASLELRPNRPSHAPASLACSHGERCSDSASLFHIPVSGNKWPGSSSWETQSRWAIWVSRGVSLCAFISKIERWLELKERIKYTHYINSRLPVRWKDDHWARPLPSGVAWTMQNSKSSPCPTASEATSNRQLKHNPNPRRKGRCPRSPGISHLAR